MQGALSTQNQLIVDHTTIESQAAIDAVHFSTRIEGNALTRDQVTEALFQKKLKSKSSRDLKEVLNYSRTRQLIRNWSLKNRPFNDDWVLRHHSDLLKGIVKGKLRGHYREAQCVISDSRSRSIVYMAPEWKEVPVLVHGLLGWLRQQLKAGASPLLVAAQFHFAFVTIHPFMDGNGRLARLLTNGILLANGYDIEKYAALEKQHEKDRAAYYRALRALQAGNYYEIPPGQDIQTWAFYWLKCLLETYKEAVSRVEKTATTTAFADDPRLKQAESLFKKHQRLRASDYASLAGLGRTQAVADLNALLDAGIIVRIGGGRSTVYQLADRISTAQSKR